MAGMHTNEHKRLFRDPKHSCELVFIRGWFIRGSSPDEAGEQISQQWLGVFGEALLIA
jgi:hypothetical protein